MFYLFDAKFKFDFALWLPHGSESLCVGDTGLRRYDASRYGGRGKRRLPQEMNGCAFPPERTVVRGNREKKKKVLSVL